MSGCRCLCNGSIRRTIASWDVSDAKAASRRGAESASIRRMHSISCSIYARYDFKMGRLLAKRRLPPDSILDWLPLQVVDHKNLHRLLLDRHTDSELFPDRIG